MGTEVRTTSREVLPDLAQNRSTMITDRDSRQKTKRKIAMTLHRGRECGQ